MAVKMRQRAPIKNGQKRSVESRAAILAAAEEHFARDGLAGARTDAIARAAGVNKAMLYYYFDSKERLFQAVVEEQFRAFSESSIAILESPGSPKELLIRYVQHHFDFIEAHRRHADLFQQMSQGGGKGFTTLVRKFFAPRVDAFRRLIERGVREGAFRPVDRMHAAVSITALVVFYFSAAPILNLLSKTDAYAPSNLKLRREQVIDFIRFGLFVHPEMP